MARKKKIAVALEQFTYNKVLYKVGSEFQGTKKQADALIGKKYLKWQN